MMRESEIIKKVSRIYDGIKNRNLTESEFNDLVDWIYRSDDIEAITLVVKYLLCRDDPFIKKQESYYQSDNILIPLFESRVRGKLYWIAQQWKKQGLTGDRLREKLFDQFPKVRDFLRCEYEKYEATQLH